MKLNLDLSQIESSFKEKKPTSIQFSAVLFFLQFYEIDKIKILIYSPI
jgi:hypothetical protein